MSSMVSQSHQFAAVENGDAESRLSLAAMITGDDFGEYPVNGIQTVQTAAVAVDRSASVPPGVEL